MAQTNRIWRYLRSMDPRTKYAKAEQDIAFVQFMIKLGFEYTESADRIVKRAAHHKAVAREELGK